MILKLSNLLDYLLYQVDKPFVLLSDEINHIKDYIALEQLRFNERLVVDFNCDTVRGTTKIAPMLFLPFIENSFKHGNLRNDTLNIMITISQTNDTVFFNIENTCISSNKINRGIGLENIKKRLDLVYKNNHELTIDNTNDLFKVALKLHLN